MAAKQGKSKKSRAHKVSKGIHGGGGKVTLSELEKALMGKGAMKRIERPTRKRKTSSAPSEGVAFIPA